MNICSFLPSATEIVYQLGLQDSLKGVTHECDYPPEARNKPWVVRSVFPRPAAHQRGNQPRHIRAAGTGAGHLRD